MNVKNRKKSLSSVRPSAPHRKLEILHGVTFDNHFLFNDRIASICKSSFYHLRNINFIRKYLLLTTTEILVHAFVSSKLDYCNSLLHGLPNYQVKSYNTSRAWLFKGWITLSIG